MDLGMRVLYISSMDSGAQGYLLAKAMRDHLGWDAKALTMAESYLRYKTDWVAGHVSDDDVIEFAKSTDFFIMQDQYLGGGELRKYVNARNSCIHGLGSPLRAATGSNLVNQLRGHTLIVPPATDQTITPNLMATAFFESLIIDVDEIDTLTRGIPKNSELTVCCAVTAKKQQFIEEAKKQIEDLGIQLELVSGQSWADTIRAKARAHIILDPPSPYKAPGMNTAEGCYMDSTPVGPYSSWYYSIHPELYDYTRSYNEDVRSNGSIKDALSEAIGIEKNKTHEFTTSRKECILRYYKAEVVCKRWMHWINWALKGRI